MSKRPRDTPPRPRRFVADASNVDCPICLDPCWNPTRAEPCGHVACRECLDRMDKCPMCRAEVLSTTLSGAAASRRSHAALVSCPHCPWRGTRKQQVTQAHVICPVYCRKQAEEKMTAVMRDVYPRADYHRSSLLAILKAHPPTANMRARNWNGMDVVLSHSFFVDQMHTHYCPNMNRDSFRSVRQWSEGRVLALQSLSGPASCLLWTLLDACSTSNTELAVGLALRALAVPPTSPDAFPDGLDWQCCCLIVAALKLENSTMKELLRLGFTVPESKEFENEFSTERLDLDQMLECCIKFDDFECLRLLVRNCPFIDLKVVGVPALLLRLAIAHGRSRWIKELVTDFGCDVNSTTVSNFFFKKYPLYEAVEKNDANCVSALISQGADLDALNGEDERTALHIAVLHQSDMECLSILLAAGANTEIQDRKEATPLCIAAGSVGKLDHFKALLEAGADVNFKGVCRISFSNSVPFTLTPLAHAVLYGRMQIVAYIHEECASLNRDDIAVSEAATIAVVVGIPMLKYLVRNGYPIHIRALHVAIERRDEAIVEYLIQPKFKLVLDSKWKGITALERAVTLGESSMINKLVGRGCMLKQSDENLAIINGHIEVAMYIKSLLDSVQEETPRQRRVPKQKSSSSKKSNK